MAIDIKSMTINDRQVTLAVFRQLYEENLIADDGRLNGLPWGIINHCPSKDCSPQGDCNNRDESGHHHVVWQKGDELRRATVTKALSFIPYWSETVVDYVAATIRDIALGCSGTMPEIDRYSNLCGLERGGLKLAVYIDDKLAKLLRTIASQYACENNFAFKGSREMQDLAEYRLGTHAELERQLDQEIAAELARRERWSGTVKQLHSLPQLFIAV
jgi:hypothetical protein